MSRIKRFTRADVTLVLLWAAALLSAGCQSEHSASNNANAPTRPPGASGTAATAPPTATTTQQASPAQATIATPNAPTEGAPAGLPIADAAAFRDRLLELAREARPASQASWANAEAIRNSWQKQYPNLKFTLFYSMAADPQTVSASDAFLISGVSGNFDQLYAFAVADTSGKCAGGAAVIPGDSARRKVSDEKTPTAFVPIEMSTARSCTGEAAGNNYKP